MKSFFFFKKVLPTEKTTKMKKPCIFVPLQGIGVTKHKESSGFQANTEPLDAVEKLESIARCHARKFEKLLLKNQGF